MVKTKAGEARDAGPMGTMTFKQEQQKVSSAFWVAFPARPVETGGQRQEDLLGRCDRSPGRDGRTSFRATFVPGEGCLNRQQIYLRIKMVCGGWGCPSQAGGGCLDPCEGLTPSWFSSCTWSLTGKLFPNHREGARQYSTRISRLGQSPAEGKQAKIHSPGRGVEAGWEPTPIGNRLPCGHVHWSTLCP